VQEAGAFSVVLELVPATLATEVTALLSIPTIGIGAGNGTDGQILVWTDFAGLYPGKPRKFVKQYANLRETLLGAANSYRAEVASGDFPSDENSHD
jgi:3-methyl-2-oxobutanoate hydroxymethyltransferase